MICVVVDLSRPFRDRIHSRGLYLCSSLLCQDVFVKLIFFMIRQWLQGTRLYCLVWMEAEDNSIDSNPFLRYLHLHCFKHMHRVLTRNSPGEYISAPRFQLFRRIERWYHSKQEHSLFKNLIFTFLRDVIVGIVITLISASLNLMVPQLIRQFMHFMKEKHLEESEYSDFIYVFLAIQLLRIFFSQHSKRLFHQLAIKVESTLARKLISKSLRMAKECRDRIPDSQLIQLENVDLKLIFNLFKNMNMIFQAPFTIIVAIILLFNQSSHYGVIGIYWFLIAFLLQGQLDQRMMHCNTTKLKLIEQRSNINYHLLQQFRAAKLIGWQDLIIQKNNDLFIQENHDHDLFYSYMTYYDITLLLLPIFVVTTITLFDANQDNPITVEEVYLMLSLLGICYNPMKSMRVISINLHDGLHSLSRLSKYFHFPQTTKSGLLEKNEGRTGQIIIFEGTEATHPHSSSDFNIHITQEVAIQPGQRLILLGKKNSGRSSFLQMLIGNMKRVKGKISISGKVSFFPEKLFFLKDTVKENIRFFNKKVTGAQIEQIYNQLGLNTELRFMNELGTMMDDTSKFTRATLKKIALARCLCSEADIYILNNPFAQIDDLYVTVVEKKLRELQENGKTVVLSLTRLAISDDEDQIIILEDGQISEYDYFNVLVNSLDSQIPNYFVSQEDDLSQFQPKTARRVLKRFQERVQTAINFDLKSATLSTPRRMISRKFMVNLGVVNQPKKAAEAIPHQQKFQSYVMKFLTSVSFKESIFIFFVILAAEVLHIFIHFYIGHLEEQYAKDDYSKFKNLMLTELVLTFCLAGLVYLQGEFSTLLAIIIGNNIYSDSFTELTQKSITWYSNQYNVKLADRYNHDYQQIYIACHSIFGIYKNLVILIATIEFISTNRSKLIAIFVLLAAVYYSIFILFRKIQRKIVKYYYDYKYNFVRCLEESLQGAEMIRIAELKDEVLSRAEEKYRAIASYKLSASYTTYALSLTCDILSISLLAIGIEYGIEMKAHHRDQRISVIATSIFLLMNISEVLKTIIWEMLHFQTFFSINIIPFMEIKQGSQEANNDPDTGPDSLSSRIDLRGHTLEFRNIILEQFNQNVRRDLLNFKIQQGDVVHIYQKDHRSRDLLLYGITKNLPMFNEPAHFKSKGATITLGGVSIKNVNRKTWMQHFGILLEENFFFAGTIKENISWKLPSFNPSKAYQYARQLKLYKEFAFVQGTDILEAKLRPEQRAAGSLVKKIAVLRILLRHPKIVIMKDTDDYIDSVNVTQLMKKHIADVTIIKISRLIDQCFDADRIIAMQNLVIREDGSPDELKEDSNSKVGREIEDINLRSYKFMKKASKKAKGNIVRHDNHD